MSETSATPAKLEKVPAGCMPPWDLGELPPAPVFNWRNVAALVGPGLMMAGANIGGGEWLFGPAVTAQYGATLMWLAGLSIAFQLFYNLEVMRYTLYCGEPIVTGYFRTIPGPRFWTFVYIFLDFGAIWPYLASNAAVPLAAAILGHLPGSENVIIAGVSMGEDQLVRVLGYLIFMLAFIPLIFGGKIYNALEKLMVIKIVLVLGYLTFVAVFLARASTVGEVFVGFFRIGTVPLRAQTVIVGDRFTITERGDDGRHLLKGTFDGNSLASDCTFEVGTGPDAEKYVAKELGSSRLSIATVVSKGITLEVTAEAGSRLMGFAIKRGRKKETFESASELLDHTGDLRERARQRAKRFIEVVERRMDRFQSMLAQAREQQSRGGFRTRFIEDSLTLEITGTVADDKNWQPTDIAITVDDRTDRYSRVEDVPQPYRRRVEKFIANQGLEPVGLIRYLVRHGRLPELNWGVLAGFAAIAGAGGLSNAQFSNYARDKGWGMGPLVGAIPSAIGGQKIELSHVGMAFRLTPESLSRWRGWFRHILRDQLMLWVGGCFLGMALPSILSLEFIRNAPVEGNKVAAMTAEGISLHAGRIFWPLTLLCGFLVLGPTQVVNMDGIIRRWTDVIWTGTPQLKKLGGNQVKYVYYTIMFLYGVWGVIALWKSPDPLVLVIASTVFMNLALGFASFHTLWVNVTFLPRELRPNWIMRIGLVGCGIFFLGICAIALKQQLPALAGWLSGQR